MKKLLLITLFFGTINLFSQSPDQENMMKAKIKETTDKLKVELNLDKKQTTEINKLLTNFAKQTSFIMEPYKSRKPSPQEMISLQNSMKEQSDMLDFSIEGLLNKEQKTKYREMKKKEEERMRRGRGQI